MDNILFAAATRSAAGKSGVAFSLVQSEKIKGWGHPPR
jgi:hypothetical protein